MPVFDRKATRTPRTMNMVLPICVEPPATTWGVAAGVVRSLLRAETQRRSMNCCHGK